jgi:hypothetical protein
MKREQDLLREFVGCLLEKKAAHSDMLPGGEGDDNPDAVGIDPDELAMGLEHEMEHTDDEAIAREIAIDHITEDPQYYTNLKRFGAHEAFKRSITDDESYAKESLYVPKERKAEVDGWLKDMGLAGRRKKRAGSK